DVVNTKLGLHSDVRSAQVIIGIQDIGKAHNLGHVLSHACKLVQHLALCLGQSGLPGGGGASQRTSVQEGVKVTKHHILQAGQEGVVALFHSDSSAVLVHVLNGHSLGVFLDGQIVFLGGGDGGFAVGDHLTGTDVAGFQRHAGGIRNQLGAGRLADGAHDAQNLAQGVPVVVEPGDEVYLPGGHAGIVIG